MNGDASFFLTQFFSFPPDLSRQKQGLGCLNGTIRNNKRSRKCLGVWPLFQMESMKSISFQTPQLPKFFVGEDQSGESGMAAICAGARGLQRAQVTAWSLQVRYVNHGPKCQVPASHVTHRQKENIYTCTRGRVNVFVTLGVQYPSPSCPSDPLPTCLKISPLRDGTAEKCQVVPVHPEAWNF